MSADNDRLRYSSDPKHAKDRITYDEPDSILNGSTTALSSRGRHSEIKALTASLMLAPAVPAAQLGAAEITAKIPIIPADNGWHPTNGSAATTNWPGAAAVPDLAVAIGEQRAIDTLAQVGVKSAVRMHSQRGWRRLLYRTTRINLGLSRDELYELDLYARIRRNARDTYQIGIVGLKGGVGKSAVTVALGSTLSKVRGDRILAVDADPAGGNLADRVGRQSAATVVDLLAGKDLTRYNDIRAYTSMNESKLEVLSSQEYSSAQRSYDDADWKAATGIVARHYNLVLADCAADMFQPAARGVLASVSGIVIVASASIDGARQAAVTMDWLRRNGHQELLSRSCVVINHVGSPKPNVDIDDLVQQFQKHVPPGRVFVLPWDKHIAAGTEIQLDLLRPKYQRRILELAAALSDDFDGPQNS